MALTRNWKMEPGEVFAQGPVAQETGNGTGNGDGARFSGSENIGLRPIFLLGKTEQDDR